MHRGVHPASFGGVVLGGVSAEGLRGRRCNDTIRFTYDEMVSGPTQTLCHTYVALVFIYIGISRRIPPSLFGGVFRRGVSPEGEGQGTASAGEPDGAHRELRGRTPGHVAERCEL